MSVSVAPSRHLPLIALLVMILFLVGCATNPVTGERRLSLFGMSESEEIEIGREHYKPTIQTQGGLYYLDPELTEYVAEVSQKLAEVSDRPDLPYEFVIINSSIPNAWALPGGKIAINRGLLLEMETEGQLAAVMGHEIVHAAASHGAQRMQRGQLINLGLAGLSIGLLATDNRYAGLLVGGAAIGSQIALAQYSQSHELESDEYGIRYMAKAGYDPSEGAELQRVFLRLSEGQNPDFISGLFATHPPSQRRVEQNERLAERLGREGRIGRETYQEMTAGIREKQPAYERYREAAGKYRDEAYDEAEALVDEAIAKVPDEAKFLALRGDIHRARGDRERALTDLDKAVELYPEMFAYRISRGLVHRDLRNWERAEADFQASVEVVPTGIGYLGLGDAVREQGRRDEAREHYQRAAQAGGEIGGMAQRRLEDLDR